MTPSHDRGSAPAGAPHRSFDEPSPPPSVLHGPRRSGRAGPGAPCEGPDRTGRCRHDGDAGFEQLRQAVHQHPTAGADPDPGAEAGAAEAEGEARLRPLPGEQELRSIFRHVSRRERAVRQRGAQGQRSRHRPADRQHGRQRRHHLAVPGPADHHGGERRHGSALPLGPRRRGPRPYRDRQQHRHRSPRPGRPATTGSPSTTRD